MVTSIPITLLSVCHHSVIEISSYKQIYILNSIDSLEKLELKQPSKEYHHGRFQQQSPQHFFDRYEHMDNLRNCMILQLKPLQVVYFLIN